MTTRAPAWRSPRAIIIPMPLVPPVTRPRLPLRGVFFFLNCARLKEPPGDHHPDALGATGDQAALPLADRKGLYAL